MRRDHLTDELAHKLLAIVRQKAFHLLRNARGRADDLDELVCELIARILVRLPDFDARRSSLRTFLHRVIDKAWADIRRHRRAAKRDGRREAGSLNAHGGANDSTGVRVLDLIDSEGQRAMFGRHVRRDRDLGDLKLDIESVVGTLLPTDRELCEEVQHNGVAGAARNLGIHRGTVYRRLNGLKPQFEDKDLRDYLD